MTKRLCLFLCLNTAMRVAALTATVQAAEFCAGPMAGASLRTQTLRQWRTDAPDGKLAFGSSSYTNEPGDDHEYGPNDASASYPLKGESLKLFKRYFANPGYGLPETPGIFGNFIFNDAEFFLTDNRYHRDSDKLIAEDKTMFGAAQLRWLKNSLLASISPVKIVVVGSQVTNTVNTWDGWHNYPKERAEFLKFLTDQKINGVLIFSGDRHFTELLRTEREGTYPLYELTCSPLTSGVPAEVEAEKRNPQVVAGTFVTERNFCTVDFSGTKAARKLTIRSFSTESRQLWEKEIAVSELRTPQ